MWECMQMGETLDSRLARIRFSPSRAGGDRIHYVTEEDIRVVLSRLPCELWQRLRAVHFNDRSRGARILGYVNRSKREIALCALPPRIGLTCALVEGQTPGSSAPSVVRNGRCLQSGVSSSMTCSCMNSDTCSSSTLIAVPSD